MLTRTRPRPGRPTVPAPVRVRAARLVVLALLLPASSLVTALPAASSGPSAEAPPRCERASLATQAKQARAVFTGTVDGVVREEQRGSSVDFVTTVQVDRVYKPGRGSLITREEIDVVTQRIRGACTLGPLQVDERYLFFAGVSDGDLVATGDGGTRGASPALVSAVEDLLGSGRSAVPPPPESASFTPVTTAEPATFGRTAAPGAVVAGVALLLLVVLRRFSRR